MLPRIAGGAITGAATAGMVNPDDVVSGGVVGAAMPVGVKALGMAGGAIGRQFRPGASPGLARLAMDKGLRWESLTLPMAR